MSTDIKITYTNKSYHRGHPTVVVFTKPITSSFVAQPTVWQAIKNIGYNSWHKFTYTLTTSVQVSWNHNGQPKTLTMEAAIGKNYSFEETEKGFSLVENCSSQEPYQFEIVNNVSTIEEISVVAFKDGNPIQFKEQVRKNQKVVFALPPQLCFKISSEYNVGDIVSPKLIDEEVTEISMQGLYSFDVILKGDANNAYTFERDNEVLALWGRDIKPYPSS